MSEWRNVFFKMRGYHSEVSLKGTRVLIYRKIRIPAGHLFKNYTWLFSMLWGGKTTTFRRPSVKRKFVSIRFEKYLNICLLSTRILFIKVFIICNILLFCYSTKKQ